VGDDLLTRGGAVETERVWDAMAGAAELPRPVPVAGEELADLVDWARAHAADGDGRCSVLFEVLDGGGRAARGDAPPAVPADPTGRGGYRMFREAVGLVRRLRAAEADRAHGSWIFFRLETTATWYTVERCYDWWPAWMPRSRFAGPSVRALGREMGRRAPEYRPAWAELLTA
jgi:hypothetical protein